jgi:3-oxoacid CoA-transferase subunit A
VPVREKRIEQRTVRKRKEPEAAAAGGGQI